LEKKEDERGSSDGEEERPVRALVLPSVPVPVVLCPTVMW
jgi:hypothetical protein